ncbi:MAG: dTDP-4-dehydrorhamnose reductase [Hyphomonas sp.]
MTEAPILVIGQSGQVAQALAALGRHGMVFAGRPEADLTDQASLARVLDRVRPAIILNTGAYTSVDGAESEPEAARAANADGPASLAQLCARAGVPLIHLSTDCVFDGRKASAYEPGDVAAPLCVYGATKWAGEQAVAAAAPRHLILRVSWIFSQFGNNFVRAMLKAALSRADVTVVDDQFGCPTHALALAQALMQIADAAGAPGFTAWGVYHLAGSGETDRASMARAIYAESARQGGPSARVTGVPTEAYLAPARRPLNARLDMTRTTDVFGVTLPDWRLGLAETVTEILKESAIR